MTVLSPSDLALLRTQPHRSRLYLSIYQPATLVTGRVNMPAITRGEIHVDYTVSTGTYSNVKPGMTVLIGLTPGGQELGRLRVRSLSNVLLTVAANSVVWQDNAYLTFIEFYELWAVYPRIVTDGINIPTFYKDYDLTYGSQDEPNRKLDPIPVMGPHLAGYIDPDTNKCRFYFDGSQSYDLSVGGGVVSHSWEFPGADTPTSAVATPGWIEWSAATAGTISLTVTSSLGKSFTSYRHFTVYDKPGGASQPFKNWSTDSLTGSFDSGGWSGSLTIRENADLSVVRDGALVVIFSDDWYGTTKQSIGGNYPNRENIVFVGYVRDGSIEIDPETSAVTFQITNLQGKMQSSECTGVSLEPSTLPTNWYQINQMTTDRALQHYIRWHTTIYSIADVNPVGDSLFIMAADFSRAFLYGNIEQFLQTNLAAKVGVDRQGQLWMQRKIEIVPVGSRAVGTIMSLTRQDWTGNLGITQSRDNKASYVEVQGTQYMGPNGPIYDPLTAEYYPIISCAPGLVPDYQGNPNSVTVVAQQNQIVCNQLAGDWLAMLNKHYPDIRVALTGNWRVADIMPQERMLLTIPPDENYLGLDWVDKPFIPRQVTIAYDNAESNIKVSLNLTEETDGVTGIAGPYPASPPNDQGDQTTEPILPPTPPPVLPLQPVDGSQVYVATATDLRVTFNFYDPDPIWSSIKGVISGTFTDFTRDPYDYTTIMLVATTNGIWRTANLTMNVPVWLNLYSAGAFATATGKTLDKITSLTYSPGLRNLVFACALTVDNYIYAGRSLDGGVTWTWVSVAQWPGPIVPSDADFSPTLKANNTYPDIVGITGGIGSDVGSLYVSTDATTSFTFTKTYTTGIVGTTNNNLVIESESANDMLMANPTDVGRSTDGGYSFANITPASHRGTRQLRSLAMYPQNHNHIKAFLQKMGGYATVNLSWPFPDADSTRGWGESNFCGWGWGTVGWDADGVGASGCLIYTSACTPGFPVANEVIFTVPDGAIAYAGSAFTAYLKTNIIGSARIIIYYTDGSSDVSSSVSGVSAWTLVTATVSTGVNKVIARLVLESSSDAPYTVKMDDAAFSYKNSNSIATQYFRKFDFDIVSGSIGSLQGWWPEDGLAGFFTVCESSTDFALSGTRSLKVVASGAADTDSYIKWFPTYSYSNAFAGQRFRASVRVASISGPCFAYLRIYYNDDTFDDSEIADTTGNTLWHSLEAVVSGPNDGKVIKFFAITYTQGASVCSMTFYVDDIYIELPGTGDDFFQDLDVATDATATQGWQGTKSWWTTLTKEYSAGVGWIQSTAAPYASVGQDEIWLGMASNMQATAGDTFSLDVYHVSGGDHTYLRIWYSDNEWDQSDDIAPNGDYVTHTATVSPENEGKPIRRIGLYIDWANLFGGGEIRFKHSTAYFTAYAPMLLPARYGFLSSLEDWVAVDPGLGPDDTLVWSSDLGENGAAGTAKVSSSFAPISYFLRYLPVSPMAIGATGAIVRVRFTGSAEDIGATPVSCRAVALITYTDTTSEGTQRVTLTGNALEWAWFDLTVPYTSAGKQIQRIDVYAYQQDIEHYIPANVWFDDIELIGLEPVSGDGLDMLMISTDKGDNWSEVGASYATFPRALFIWPYDDSFLFWLDTEHVLYSTDGGATTELKNGNWANYASPVKIDPVWVL